MKRTAALLLVVLAVAAVIALLSAREADVARARASKAVRVAEPVASAPQPVAPPEAARALLVSVRDEGGRLLRGARCEALAWGSSAETDDLGLARVPVPKGARTEITVRALKDGYRPATRRCRFEEGRTLGVRLLRAPPIRVLDTAGKAVAGALREPLGSDLREQRVRAKGYLDLDLKELPHEVLAAWDDLLRTDPVDLYMVPTDGLACAVLRVEGPAAVAIDLAASTAPDLGPRLRDLPPAWRAFYATASRRLSPRALDALRAGDEIRVYALGKITVSWLAPECRPLRQEIEIPAGSLVTRALVLEPEPWVDQAVVVSDRFAREGPLSFDLLNPVLFRLSVRGSTVRVPRGGPFRLRADGGARGEAVQTVLALPQKEPLRFELKGIEVHVRILDEETCVPIEGLDLRVEGRETAVRWNPDEEAYVLGPLDPGTVTIAIGTERIDVRVDPRDAVQEIRLRGGTRGGSGGTDRKESE